MWQKILKMFIQKGWPIIILFFKKYQDEIMQYVFELIDSLLRKGKIASGKAFRAKAQHAEQMARESTDAHKAKEYAAQAEAFRQAIEILEKQNEELREDLTKTRQYVEEAVAKNTTSLRAEDLFKSDLKGSLSLKEKSSYLAMEAPRN